MQAKGLFKSVGAISSLIGIFTGLMAWYNKLPPELISDTQALLVLLITQIGALYGRWKGNMPLSVLRPFRGKLEILPKL